eukprot:SAG22_NODE_1842_length_3456_cov_3.666369_2_plen_57_part_00
MVGDAPPDNDEASGLAHVGAEAIVPGAAPPAKVAVKADGSITAPMARGAVLILLQP